MNAPANRHDEGLTPEQIAERNSKREVQLALTYRMAGIFLSLARAARRKAAKQHEANVRSGWKPEPGKFDINLTRIGIMDDVIAQLEPFVGDIQAAKAEFIKDDDGDENAQ